MTFTLLLLAILLTGLILGVIGGILLLSQINKLVGRIVFVVGSLTALFSILGFLSLVVISQTIG
jgi:hypothetical protein